MAAPQISNQPGAFGLPTTSNDSSGILIPFVNGTASTTITKGTIVALSTTSGKVIACLTNTTAGIVSGIATETFAAGATGLVCVEGPVFNVSKDTAAAVTIGDPLGRSASITGSVLSINTTAITQYKDLNQDVGYALASAVTAATVCDVFVTA